MSETFIEVAASSRVKEGRAHPVNIDGKKIVLFRSKIKVYALRDSCPHQGAPLSDGYVEDGCAVCFYHDWKFRLEDGAFTHNEQIKIPTYSVKEESGKIYIAARNSDNF